MDCATYESEYSALIDGELTPARESLVRAHVDDCEDCRAQLEALRRVDRALGDLSPPSLPEDLRSRLQARIEQPGERPAGQRAARRSRRWLAAPAAALAAAAAMVFYLASPATEPSSERGPVVVASATPAGADPAAISVSGSLAPVLDARIEVIDLESAEDLDVIVNLELLEAFVALQEGTG